jgi:hypothetical protein
MKYEVYGICLILIAVWLCFWSTVFFLNYGIKTILLMDGGYTEISWVVFAAGY